MPAQPRGENYENNEDIWFCGDCVRASLGLAHKATAQVSVGIGVAPVCPYGYYEAPPYNCAPDGYYGPEWFSGGVFDRCGSLVPWPGSLLRTRRSLL